LERNRVPLVGPESVPLVPAPSPEESLLRLNPIYFRWDSWSILPVAAAKLRHNAQIFLAHPELKIVVLGSASEEGTTAHNLPLSQRRAQAAYDYLRALGVPAERMRVQGLGELPGRPLPLYRAVHFEFETEKQKAHPGNSECRTSKFEPRTSDLRAGNAVSPPP
jgi:hypothetical protein